MANAIRDFRESTLGDLNDAFGEGIVDSNPDKGWDAVEDYFAGVLGVPSIKDDMSNVRKYLKKVCELNDVTAEQLKTIVLNVRDIENTYKAKFEPGRQALIEYKLMLDDLNAEMSGNFPDSVNFEELAGKLEPRIGVVSQYNQAAIEKLQEEVQLEMDKMRDPETGEYDWEYIEYLLQSDLEDLTPAQIAALGLVFVQMEQTEEGAEDMEHFIALSYQKQVVSYGSDRMPVYNYAPSPAFKLAAATVSSTMVAIASITTWNPNVAEEDYPFGLTAEQINQYLTNSAIMADVAVSGAMPYNDTHARPNKEVVGTEERNPVEISFNSDGTYTLEVAQSCSSYQYITYDVFDNYKSITGYPLTTSDSLASNQLHENIKALQALQPGVGFADAASGEALDWLGGKAVEALAAALGASAGVAGGIATGVMAVIGVITTITDNIALTENIQAIIDASTQILIYEALGYSVMYSVVNGTTLIVHAIYWDEKTRYLTIAAYNEAHGTDYSADQIEAIMRAGGSANGEPNYLSDKELERLGLTRGQQQDIFENMMATGAEDRNDYTKTLASLYSDMRAEYGTSLLRFDELSVEQLALLDKCNQGDAEFNPEDFR